MARRGLELSGVVQLAQPLQFIEVVTPLRQFLHGLLQRGLVNRGAFFGRHQLPQFAAAELPGVEIIIVSGHGDYFSFSLILWVGQRPRVFVRGHLRFLRPTVWSFIVTGL